ncbi:MAG: hypothetical protein JXB00_15255 [Bacteroidales bacterium]|nr:hypothetical protein [Bacteroidales bacterium]
MKPKAEDNISGFLDGYKARNIAILEDTLVYDIKDLEKLLFLLTELAKENQDFRHEFETISDIYNHFKNNSFDILSRLIELGGDLNNFLDIIKDNFKGKYSNRIEDIIFKYIEICEKSKNQELLKRAIKVASKINS